MNIEYDRVYEFDLKDKVSFGDLSQEQVYKLFRDGRVSSKFLEHSIPLWFEELTYVDAKGYDHVHQDGRRFDLKGFTKGGASYAPSSMLGAGRRINIEEMHAHARTIDYIISDITEFPRVRVIFKHGADLVENYPSGRIDIDQKEVLFG